VTPEEAVQTLTRVGGVPVLAHPAYLKNMEASIAKLKTAGLLGLEVHYAQFDADTRRKLERLAAQYDLIPCGGSDYHGLGNSGEPLPGTLGPPLSTVERLEEAASKLARTFRS
jgi:predicted metal-dependent phosphoesterase TrpH